MIIANTTNEIRLSLRIVSVHRFILEVINKIATRFGYDKPILSIEKEV